MILFRYTHSFEITGQNVLQTLLLTFLCVLPAFAHESDLSSTIYSNGIGIGSALAITISWSRNKSILWAILHGIFSWLYVIYYYISYDK